MTGKFKRVLEVVSSLAFSAAALGFAAWALPLSRYEPRQPANVRTETVAVVERENDLAAPASIALQWSEGQSLSLGGDGGLVTRVIASPGIELECGSPVVEVNGLVKYAYCGPRPMWQPIDGSSSALEATEFVSFLRSIGFFNDFDRQPTGRELRSAIRGWQTLTAQPVTGVVAPGDMIWIGSGPVTPTSVIATAGEPLEERGVVGAIAPGLVSATVEGFVPDLDGSKRVVGLDGSSARASVAADGTISDLPTLMSALEEVGSLAEGLPLSVQGSTRLASARMLATVPATSVVGGEAGACVVTVQGDGSLTAVSVVPVSSSTGVIFVTGELMAGAMVAVNPDRAAGC